MSFRTDASPHLSRRELIRSATALGTWAAMHPFQPAWARSAALGPPLDPSLGLQVLSGTEFDLEIAETAIDIDGRRVKAVTINGTVPGPLLRWREGDEVTLRVTNRLDHHPTSIHWHGILLPPNMDGVPGLSFPGIAAGETFEYRFPVMQAGTYWYHSHSGLQEQIGHYGPLVIEPAGRDPVAFDREYVVVLSDWSYEDPHRLFAKLKKKSDLYNFQKRTVGDFFDDARENGFGRALENRKMWGAMRMDPTDLADVTAATYLFLINGHSPSENWTALFEPGERVRLRFVNASAMTLFNVRIPGLAMTVVQSDGLDVAPVETDEFQIGVAETYDVIVQPQQPEAFTLMCETIDRSGYARATLAPRPGLEAPVPPLRPRSLLTMKDMGMSHGEGHATSRTTMDHGTDHGARSAVEDHGSHEGAAHAQPSGASAPAMAEHPHPSGPGVDNTAMDPTNRLAEPGVGLEDVGHRVLTYADLRSLEPNPDLRTPERQIEVHLTGNMERYMWSFDGVKFSDAREPIFFHKDERLRLTLLNDTMMAHPIHLHGMFFDLVHPDRPDGVDDHKARKHTVVVKPGERLSVDITADAVGDWAFHCHLLYHMHAGMFRVVSVRDREVTT